MRRGHTATQSTISALISGSAYDNKPILDTLTTAQGSMNNLV